MPRYCVPVIAFSLDDEDDEFVVGRPVVEATDQAEASRKALDHVWDSRLDNTCGARFRYRLVSS